MTVTTSTAPGAGRSRRHGPAATLVALVFVVLSYGLMQTMLVPTVAVLQRELHTTAAGASWAVLSATLLTSAVVTPLVGRLADRHGKRRVLLGSLGVYLVGTLGAIIAPNVAILIAFRAVQGISLALLPLSFAIAREALPSRWLPFGLALTSGLVGGTAGIGLLLGGLVVDHASWRWLFAIGSALVLAALALTVAFVPSCPATASGRLDLPGTLTMAAGLAALLLGITQGPAWGWGSPAVLGLFAGAVLLLAVFGAIERRVAHPVIDITLLTHRPLLIAHLGALTLGMNQFVFYVLLPRLAELPDGPSGPGTPSVSPGFGLTVTGAALMLLPGTLLTLPASWLSPRIEHRLGVRGPLVLGLTLAAVGSALLTVWHGQVGQVVIWYLIGSAGYGFAMAALPRLVNNASSQAHSGSANSINTVARTFGGAVGSQLGTSVVAGAVLPGTTLPTPGGFTAAFLIAAVAAALGAVFVPLARAAD